MNRHELQIRRNVFVEPETPADGSALATKMTMTRFHAVAIAAGLVLAVSGPSFAAKRTSDAKSAVKSQSRATKSGDSAIRPYSRYPYPYSRDPDPYAPGVNWPKGY